MFWHHAIEYVGAGLATVLGNLQVLIVGVVAWLVLGERPSRAMLLAAPGRARRRRPHQRRHRRRARTAATRRSASSWASPTALCYAGYLLIIRLGGRDPRRPAGPVAVATLGDARSSRSAPGLSSATST